jgi:antitoxin MazE
MRGKVVRIGNSQGVRIPKSLLQDAQLSGEVDMTVVDDGLLITPVIEVDTGLSLMLASHDALSDWERPEEEEAWASLQ